MKRYKITWGQGQTQGNLSKTEVLKVDADLLKTYDFVSISTYLLLKGILQKW